MSYNNHLPIKDKISLNHITKLIDKKIREDETIDYKQQLPKDITRTVCAFLNTFGGHIVLGVKEENEVPTQIVGFDSKEISTLNQRNQIK